MIEQAGKKVSIPLTRALGATRDEIALHVNGSPHFREGQFHNLEHTQPQVEGASGGGLGATVEMLRRPGRPKQPVRVLTPEFRVPHFDDDDRGELSATWLGHATVLVELDGVRILTDPVLSRRCSPSRVVGPARMHPAPSAVGDLPAIDVVLISHDHYDHLDLDTIAGLAVTQPHAVFVCPIGVGAHLMSWGIGAERIREADWDDTVDLQISGATIRFTCCPARHFSGRVLYRNVTQWASWSVAGPRHSVFFSGDTGYSEHFADVGARLGPFDLTLIAIGAYDPLWPDIHLDPEGAIAVHRMLSGEAGRDAVMIPIHWATFNLARHAWAEPVARVLPAADANATSVLVPPPGGFIDIIDRVGTGLADSAWWERSA